MPEYQYKRWSGARCTVTAGGITFEPTGHVAFWTDGQLVLAERSEQVNELTQVGNNADPALAEVADHTDGSKGQ